MMAIATNFDWKPVVNRKAEPYLYPNDLSTLSRDLNSRPAIYRWSLGPQDGRNEFLVGETENLYRRIGHYLKHKSGAHVEFRNSFDKARNSGREVSLQILKFEPFNINGIIFSLDRLHDPFVRLVLENLCCLQVLEDGSRLVNAAVKKQRKGELNKALREHPEEVLRIIEEIKSQKAANAS
jgi:hypothetical protein